MLLRNLDITVNFSRLNATYVNFPNGGGVGIDYDGNQLEYAPKWTGSTDVNYTQPVGACFGGYWNIGSSLYYSAPVLPTPRTVLIV